MSLSHPWKIGVYMSGTTDRCTRSTFKSYSMPDVRKLVVNIRKEEEATGKHKRKISPITTWILEDAISKYMAEFSKDYLLEKLEILDLRHG
jgi:hypothetical protein